MHCEDVKLKLDAYVLGDLAEDVRCEVDLHLTDCPACRQALGRTRKLTALLGNAKTPPVPRRLARRIMAAARGRKAPAWSPIHWWKAVSAPLRAAAAAVMAVGLLTGIMMGVGTLPANVQAGTQVSQADLLRDYNLDFLGEAPSGTLVKSYFTLLASPGEKER